MLNFFKNIIKNPSITGPEALQKVKSGKSVLLDVREENEWKLNSIKGSLHIPVGEVKKRLFELKQYEDLEIIVFCVSGARSSMASAILNSNGFNALNLLGGIGAYQ